MEICLINDKSDKFDRVRELQAQGHTVVRSIRPIPGEQAWEDEDGSNYAAAINDNPKFLNTWESHEAKEIKFISNEEIIDHMTDHCEKKYFPSGRLAMAVAKQGERVYSDLARSLNLPYWRTDV